MNKPTKKPIESQFSSIVAVVTVGLGCALVTGCSGGAGESTASSSSSADSLASIAQLALDNVGKSACSENSLGGYAFESSCTITSSPYLSTTTPGRASASLNTSRQALDSSLRKMCARAATASRSRIASRSSHAA